MTSSFSDVSEIEEPTGMLTPTWQMDLFICETILFIPIYICILLDIVVSRGRHKSFQSPYYSLMVSQGLADICAIAIFFSLIAARYFSFGNVLIYSLSPYSAIAYTNSGPFMFTLRAVGVFLVTTQRYLTVCRSHGTVNYHLNHCPPILLGVGHWTLAFLIYLPALLNSDAYFENETTLFTIASTAHLQYTSITNISSFLVVGVSLIVMYSRIAVMMIRARRVSHSSSTMPIQKSAKKFQDARLILHVFVLVCFCFIAFFYYIGEYILAFDPDRSHVKSFRLWFPTVSGHLSFINPIMLLALNKDVQSRCKLLFCCCLEEKQSHSSHSVAPIGKSTTGNIRTANTL